MVAQIIISGMFCMNGSLQDKTPTAMMAMLSRAQLLGGLDVDIKCRLFDVLVGKCYDSLENTLLKFCKLALGVPNSATTDAVLGELARFPLWITMQFSCSAVLG